MSSTEGTPSIGFAERMSSNMKIKAAYRSAYPRMSPSELASKASSSEERIYSLASSPDIYRTLCSQACSDVSLEQQQQQHQDGSGAMSQQEPQFSPNNSPFEEIGPYKAQHHASGLFSTVYQARSPDNEGFIAIKVTRPAQMSAPHDSEREARLLQQLRSDAASVVPLLSIQWLAGGIFLLVLPFLPCDLGQLLDQHRLSARQKQLHLHALFKALEHSHSHGIIHRDVKPSNLISRGPDGPVYLADFGIAWSADDPASEPANEKITDVGTTCYRPPELLFGHASYTAKLDMWAAGCVVAECLRDGKTLFDAGDLGSELALLRSIFTTLGTPNDAVWPEARTMPDWGKMQFTQYPARSWQDVLPGADPMAITLVEQLVRFQSTERLSAAEVLQTPYFEELQ